MFDILQIGVAVQAAGARSGWEGWPFSGINSPWLAGALRLLFVACIFVLIGWFLRKLFGPGGWLRPEEFGTGHIAERQAKKRRAKELRAQWKAGEIGGDEYNDALKELWKDAR